METFVQLNNERGITIVLVTHELEVAAYTRRVVQMRDGRIVSDAPPERIRVPMLARPGHLEGAAI
jgi:ABC-type phosphate/phosphonate transport system ATPase subunit